jgi:hypothetical protein
MNLKEAQQGIESGGFLPNYTAQVEQIARDGEKKVEISEKPTSLFTKSSISSMQPAWSIPKEPEIYFMQSTQNFMILPTEAQQMPPILTRQIDSPSAAGPSPPKTAVSSPWKHIPRYILRFIRGQLLPPILRQEASDRHPHPVVSNLPCRQKRM